MPPTLRVSFAIVHLTIAVFLALTSWPIVRPVLGVGGYILIVLAIDFHAYVRTVQWTLRTPGEWNMNLAGIIILTLMSGSISFFGADITAEYLTGGTPETDKYIAEISKEQRRVETINAKAMEDYQQKLADEEKRWEEQRQAKAAELQKRIRSLENQAWALRKNDELEAAAKISSQVASLVNSSQGEYSSSILPPVMIDPNAELISYLKGKIDKDNGLRTKFTITARILEIGLTIIMLIYVLSTSEKDYNIFFAAVDSLITNHVTEPNHAEPNHDSVTEPNHDSVDSVMIRSESQRADTEVVCTEPYQTESWFGEGEKSGDTDDENHAEPNHDSVTKPYLIVDGKPLTREVIRSRWNSAINRYKAKGLESDLDRALMYWELFQRISEEDDQPISDKSRKKMQKYLLKVS